MVFLLGHNSTFSPGVLGNATRSLYVKYNLERPDRLTIIGLE